jgi:hypothetical protein
MFFAGSIMGILPPARILTHALGAASETINIERLAQPPNVAGTYLMAKAQVADTGGLQTYYTIESRKRVGYDQNVPGDGVIIHRVVQTNLPLSPDATIMLPTGTTGGVNAIWAPGSTFLSVADNVSITVNSYNASTGTASVTITAATDPGPRPVTTHGSVAEAAAKRHQHRGLRSARFAPPAVWTTSTLPLPRHARRQRGGFPHGPPVSVAPNITVGTAGIPIIGVPGCQATQGLPIRCRRRGWRTRRKRREHAR